MFFGLCFWVVFLGCVFSGYVLRVTRYVRIEILVCYTREKIRAEAGDVGCAFVRSTMR